MLITGASSGIGAALATLLGSEGARLGLAGRDRAALDQLAARTGGDAFAADLSLPGRPAEVVEAAAARLGGLDVVVANAGAGWAGSFAEMTSTELDYVIELNFKAPAQLARAALPFLMSAGGRGQLVFVGSIAGLLGVPGEAAYSAAKAGTATLADALRAELAASAGSAPGASAGSAPGRAVAVTLVSPGVVDTAFFARRNLGYQRRWPSPIPPQRVAEAIRDAMVNPTAEVIVPAWLALPVRLKGMAPGLYRLLAGRFS